MGLTHSSTGRGAAEEALVIQKEASTDRVIALAGNPNVGKSTLFNALTGMNQHTGNWPGKTVTNAQGRCRRGEKGYVLVDLPGTYSLMAHSAEEEVARSFICFGSPDGVAVVCDATCLERNLNLVLQTLELCPRVVVCVNLMDEAKRKGIHIDLEGLSRRLGVPVVGTVARKKKSLDAFLAALDQVAEGEAPTPLAVRYPQRIENAIAALTPLFPEQWSKRLNPRWLALKLLEGDEAILREAFTYLGEEESAQEALKEAAEAQREELARWGFGGERFRDLLVSSLLTTAEGLCREVVPQTGSGYSTLDGRLDRLLTSKGTGYPIMLALLAVVFWLTIVGANYPSQLLSTALFWVQDRLTELFTFLHAPQWLHGALVLGVYRVLAWVVSVMLPPMAIFFPLFTLLEDAGYLPRIAYNLDRPFQVCRACGKQALTMCMGKKRNQFWNGQAWSAPTIQALLGDEKMDFDYYYGKESSQFSFYRIPRQLITGMEFRRLTTDAKLLYGLLFDRMGLSARNGWYDGQGRVFIYYTLAEIQEDLGCGHAKAVKLLAELDTGKGCGLIERVKQGQGRPTRIYVKRFTSHSVSAPSTESEPVPEVTQPGNQDCEKPEVKSSEKRKSRLPKRGSQDFRKSDASYIEYNQTDFIQTDPSIYLPTSAVGRMDRYDYRKRENTGDSVPSDP